MSYTIFLDNKTLGTSDLEKADASMGVVQGKIKFTEENFDYIFLSNYCRTNSIKTEEYPKDKFISTQNIPNLKVYNEKGIEIKRIGCIISGMDSEEFEISIIGIPYLFYQEEFPKHVEEYEKSSK